MAIRPTPAAATVPTRNGPSQPAGRVPKTMFFSALVDDCAEDDRNQEEEREARGAVAIEPRGSARR